MAKTKKDLFDTSDTTSFVFIDDEGGHFLIEWPLNRVLTWMIFKKEYRDLLKKYEKNGRELSDFYHKLEKNLNKRQITIRLIDYMTYKFLFD